MHHAVVTDSGEISLPAEVRAAFKIEPHQELVIELHGSSLVLRPRLATLDEAFGSLREYAIPTTHEEEREAISEWVSNENPMPDEADRRLP